MSVEIDLKKSILIILLKFSKVHTANNVNKFDHLIYFDIIFSLVTIITLYVVQQSICETMSLIACEPKKAVHY